MRSGIKIRRNKKGKKLYCVVIIKSLAYYDHSHPAIKGVFYAALDDNSRKIREATKEIIKKGKISDVPNWHWSP